MHDAAQGAGRSTVTTQSAIRALDLHDLCETGRSEWTLEDVFQVMRRRRRLLLWPVAAMVALVTLYCVLATRRYEAVGQIEVQKESPEVFGLERSVMGDSSGAEADSLDYSMTLETEASILESSTLALAVVKDLHLETTQDYFPADKTGFHLPGWFFFWRKPVEPLSVPLRDAPNRRYVVLKIFAAHLGVKPVTGTRLINVTYSDPDPVRAAQVVNHLIESLTEYTFQARFNATSQASGWLASQLAGLKSQTEQLQQKAIGLQRNTGMFGDDESHNVVLARLASLNESLTEAESNRIVKEAIDRVAQSGNPDLISGLAGNTAAAGMTAANNSLVLIQSLRAQQAGIRAELAEDDTRYGDAYPKVIELRGQLDGVDKSIQDETRRIGARAHSDYEIAAQSENVARLAFEQQKTLANEMNDKALAYGLAKQEADGSRDVYQGLLAKLKQAGVLEGLRSTNLTIVNPGRTPSPSHPKSPNVPLYYAAALLAGLFFGGSAAVARELTDHSIQSLGQMERLSGAALGVVPGLRKSGWGSRLPWGDPEPNEAVGQRLVLEGDADASPFAEALRSLRTELLLSRGERPPQTILITSSVCGEGKSKVAVNLAAALAQLGVSTLLVDADLRRPSVHLAFALERSFGLGDALLNDTQPPRIHAGVQLAALSVLCAGDGAARPAELLGSKRMKRLLAEWRERYDFIVLDSPPVLPVTDALILSQICDATVLVARHGFTLAQSLERSHRILRQRLPANAVLGAVLNGVSPESAEFYEYYGYKGMPYRGTGEAHTRKHHASA
jgi:succinoglycan biosynthesis transport protein ExoP